MMETRLIRHYFFFVLPAVIMAVGFFLAEKLGRTLPGLPALSPGWHPVLFIAAAVTAIAAPIFIRTLFAHSIRSDNKVSEKKFWAFQMRLIRTSMITPYLAVAAIVFRLPKFYAAAIVLMALYAVYYFFPSARRIHFDLRIFRIK